MSIEEPANRFLACQTQENLSLLSKSPAEASNLPRSLYTYFWPFRPVSICFSRPDEESEEFVAREANKHVRMPCFMARQGPSHAPYFVTQLKNEADHTHS